MLLKTTLRKQNRKPKINIGFIIFFSIVLIFFFRVFMVLKNSTERGGLVYIQMLNFGLPVVEEQVYESGDYVENELNVKKVVLDALGLSNINGLGIINSEIAFFNQGNTGSGKRSSLIFNPFSVGESSIIRYESSSGPAYNPSLKKTLNNAKPEVYIYHSHNSEAYGEGGAFNPNEKYNVVGMGELLTKQLEEDYGISVIHDKTDYIGGDYNTAYKRSYDGAKSYVDKYGDFKLVIDLHRDGNSNQSAVKMMLNGEPAARMMLVTARNSNNFEGNNKVAQFMKGFADENFPNLSRGIMEYPSAKAGPNQGLSKNSVLIELGSEVNTVEEVQNSIPYIARLVAEYVNKK